MPPLYSKQGNKGHTGAFQAIRVGEKEGPGWSKAGAAAAQGSQIELKRHRQGLVAQLGAR